MPSTISHYRIEEEIGRGGMGVVYRAVDTRLGRAVAIKTLPAEMTADVERNRRFVQEARSASALNHPNIVTIHDIGEDAGVTFLAMELVEGTPLDKMIAEGPLPVATALDYGRQIAGALGAAHAGGIVHRDIKPANIMVTGDGHVKVLDFGLAKLVERGPGEATVTQATQAGVVLGTAAYMSPEQAEGRPVDARSDVFSFGAVLYEMLAGRRPFAASSDIGLLTAILRDPPAPLRGLRPDVPPIVNAIVERSLAKDRAARYENGAAVKRDLDAAAGAVVRSGDAAWRRAGVVASAILLLAVFAGFLGWRTVQARRAREARQEAIPRIERLVATAQSLEAMRLARDIERYAPDEVAELRRSWTPFSVTTEPAGAKAEIRNYSDVSGPWEALGVTPVRDLRMPFGFYRLRLTKAGFAPIEVSAGPIQSSVRLEPEASGPPRMVRVPGGTYGFGGSGQAVLPEFWLDRFEVTNREFKAFVDAGGYRDAKYWREPFVDGDRTLSFDEAMARFRDATGRPGPATWELGTFPEGQADFPVGGITWFEASAYAAFAGKTLPSVFHWFRAAGVDQIYSDILTFSNFDGKGPARVGERQGVGPFGTYDMAGNAAEWCANAVKGMARRYILGGGWNEPSYRFNEADAQDAWGRSVTFGMRLVKNLGPAGDTSRPIEHVNPDVKTIVPVGDAEFDAYKRFYTYDRMPLDVRVEGVDDTAPEYRKESVSFAAAYGGERVPAYMFVPKHVSPPYQTIVLFPSGYARVATSSRHLDTGSFDFLVKSGRAVLYPVYQNTFERRRPGDDAGLSQIRDMEVDWAKDFFRAVDYLETRKDVDLERLGYYSLSMGAYFGPIPLALEPRIKVAVLVAAGLRYDRPPETTPTNFMPRVKIPVLTINGKADFGASPAEQDRILELLGAPADQKRHVALEGGHVPNDQRPLIREVLDWYDKYLGVVK